jgi:hypothetical protein
MEKRRFERFQCQIKTKFNFFEGNPDEIDFDSATPSKGKGVICDISRGGACIISKERVAVGMPALVNFKTKRNKLSVRCNIVRTGLLKNNPAETALRFAKFGAFGDSYIAVEFKEPIEVSQDEL